ncbi:MAG TPA: serine/threonine-protein kinase [Pyrinomonadaceae bacterium]|jgi:serine/threonine protein kinase|nr:serine/threonine-protein kinase [Pyrinomonadaceae bacterium]
MLTEGTFLQARYRIIRQLGQGGMGAVYEAVDERLDTTVALKETLFTDEKLRKQFEREARLLARLHHPALPRVSDHFTESEGQFLVMQYIAGQDLSEMLIARNAPFSESEVMRWADQLCDALDYLHTQDPQIIHRDIKPQNLKLTARGQIVLLDFGLAKGSAGQLTAVTTSASIFGYTPNYAPLEQVQGKGTDARSDLYALGATLYHLVTNVKPPDALSRASAIVNGQDDPLLPANEVCPEVGVGLANVLAKSMSQKRDDRFANASDMRRALGGQADSYQGEETLVTAGGPASAASATVTSDKATRLVGDQTRRMTSPSFSSEAQTLVAGEATNVRTVTTGGAAIVPAPARTNWKLIAAAAVLLIAVASGVAGFYAYRRQRAQQNLTQPVEPQSSTQTQSSQSSQPSEPANNSVAPNTELKSVTETAKTNQARTDKSKPESKTEAQSNAPTNPDPKAKDPFKNFPPPEAFDPAHAGDPNRGRDRNPQPGQPPFEPMRPPGEERRPPLRLPEVRVLPNGGRMIRQPDGSVIMIGPNGKTTTIPAPPDRRGKRNQNGNSNENRPQP